MLQKNHCISHFHDIELVLVATAFLFKATNVFKQSNWLSATVWPSAGQRSLWLYSGHQDIRATPLGRTRTELN